MGASFLKIPELELDASEAKKLSEAVENVAALYPVGLSEKQIAWGQLVLVGASIYGPRVIAYGARREREKKAKPPAPVVMTAPAPAPDSKDKARPLNPQDLYGPDNAGVSDSMNNVQ